MTGEALTMRAALAAPEQEPTQHVLSKLQYVSCRLTRLGCGSLTDNCGVWVYGARSGRHQLYQFLSDGEEPQPSACRAWSARLLSAGFADDGTDLTKHGGFLMRFVFRLELVVEPWRGSLACFRRSVNARIRSIHPRMARGISLMGGSSGPGP